MEERVLEKLAAGYEELYRQAGVVSIGLSVEQCNWRPKPGRWSIAECFAHLSRTAESYLPYMEAGLANRRAAGAKAKPVNGVYQKLQTRLILSIEHRGRMRFPAPKNMRPMISDQERSAQEVLADFVGSYRAVQAYLASVESARELAIIRLSNPILPLCKLTLGQALLIHLVHARRHFEQIAELKAHPEFPRSD